MADVWIREGDTGPSLRVTLLDRDGNRVSLTGASDVTLTLATIRPRVVELDAVDVDVLQDDDDEATFGDVEYTWDELLTHDGYVGFVRVTFGDGTIISHPNDRWMTVAVPPDLVAAAS